MDTFQDDIYVLADYPPHTHTKDPAIVQFMSTFQDDIYVLASFNETKYSCWNLDNQEESISVYNLSGQ